MAAPPFRDGMHRRRFLGLASIGLVAGCLTAPGGGGSPTPQPGVAIVGTDDPPALPIRPSIEVVEPVATEARPATLLARVENTADHPVEVGEERAIVFAFVTSESRPGLTLLPAGGDYEPVEPGCWRLAAAVAIPEYYGVVALAVGGATKRRLGVWASPDGDGCLPAGEFRFETRYAGGRDRTEGLDDQEWSGTWGFTLAIN